MKDDMNKAMRQPGPPSTPAPLTKIPKVVYRTSTSIRLTEQDEKILAAIQKDSVTILSRADAIRSALDFWLQTHEPEGSRTAPTVGAIFPRRQNDSSRN